MPNKAAHLADIKSTFFCPISDKMDVFWSKMRVIWDNIIRCMLLHHKWLTITSNDWPPPQDQRSTLI